MLSRFEERHGPHAQRRNASDSGMGRSTLGRCRLREDETALAATAVYGKTNRTPELRGLLPFVDQTRFGSFEDERRLCFCQRQQRVSAVWVLHIDLACRVTLGNGGFSAPFGPLDMHCARCLEHLVQHGLYDSRDKSVFGDMGHMTPHHKLSPLMHTVTCLQLGAGGADDGRLPDTHGAVLPGGANAEGGAFGALERGGASELVVEGGAERVGKGAHRKARPVVLL